MICGIKIMLSGKFGERMEFYKGRKVFVTGHTGFCGSWLSKILLYLCADVTGYA
jgi:CDP-glucose 4,6-dehydratase